MLSRVAERLYWTARYLERVSSTATLITSYENLLYDLPKNVELSWYNLIIINDQEQEFNELYSSRSERNVIKYLIGDRDNGSSIMHSLHFIRENVRTARDVIPEKAWELICELSIYAQDNLDQGIKRRSRLEFLENIVKGCSQINGLIQSTMPRDAGWEFMLIGCNLERADMTSRYLEAGLAAILQVKDENTINSQQIIWGSVLRSLDATQYYLRATKTPVKGQAVLPYLLRDSCFPKSITYCVGSIIQSCQKLPEPELALEKLKKVESKLAKKIDYEDLGDALLEKLNKLQIMLTSIHFIISESWFIADH